MNNRVRVIILSMIIVLLTFAVGISFAYFSIIPTITNTTPVNVSFQNGVVANLVVNSDVDLNVTVSGSNMLGDSTNTVAGTDNKLLNVTLQSDTMVKCTYDVYFSWNSNTPNNYTKTTYEGDEFTVSGTTGTLSFGEVQVPNSGNEVKLGTFTINANSSIVTQSWNITANFYNINANQDAHENKTYSGKVDVRNAVCSGDYSLASNINAISNQTSSQSGGGSWAIVNEGNGLRYEGKDPDNYVCFKQSCTDDELYRIIGKFTEMVDTTGNGVADTNQSVIKLIKAKALSTAYVWNDSTNNNTWSEASLKTYLNNTWIQPYRDILTTRYYVGGHSTSNSTAAAFLNSETSGTSWDGKIGLMYVSDYGYGVLESSCSRSTTLTNYDTSGCYDNDWLYYGSEGLAGSSDFTWPITRSSANSIYVYHISSIGAVYNSNTKDYSFSVRPTFYISANNDISGGDGSKSNPYKIIKKINWGYWNTFSGSDSFAYNQMPSSYSLNKMSADCYFGSDIDAVGDTSVFTIHSTCLASGVCIYCEDNTCSNYIKNGVYDISEEFIKAGITNPTCTNSATSSTCSLYTEFVSGQGNPYCTVTNTGRFYCHKAWAGAEHCEVKTDGSTYYYWD
jgi:hypothetical protein